MQGLKTDVGTPNLSGDAELWMWWWQGFFVPAALQYAKANEARVNQLILINPPVSELTCVKTLGVVRYFTMVSTKWKKHLSVKDYDCANCGCMQVKEQHAKLPSSLAAFSTFLLGDIFAQVWSIPQLVSFCNTTTLISLIYIREFNWSAEEKGYFLNFLQNLMRVLVEKEIFLVGVSAFGIFKMIISKAS